MIRVGNAPCSWGVIENIKGQRGGYTQVLDEMHETGYEGTELGDWGFMPTDAALLKQELIARNLALIGSWVSVFLHDAARHASSKTDALRTAEQLAKVGGKDAVLILGNDSYGDAMRKKNAGRIQKEHEMTSGMWDIFITGLHKIADAVQRETGLRTAFHHHTGTWIETPEEIKKLMDRTDPALVGLVFDTGHCSFAGGDPVEMLSTYQKRIWHVHFKDHDSSIAEKSRQEQWDGVEAVEHGVFCELGKGSVDFSAVLVTLQRIHYDGWIVVEQDVLPGMGTPKQNAQRNRDYLRSIGL